MNFSAFDKTELEQYAAEAKRSWGATAAFREYEQRAKGQPEDERRAAADELMRQFAAMGRLRGFRPIPMKRRPPSGSCSRSSATVTTPVRRRFWLAWDRCTRRMNASGRISTLPAATVPLNLSAAPSQPIAQAEAAAKLPPPCLVGEDFLRGTVEISAGLCHNRRQPQAAAVRTDSGK